MVYPPTKCYLYNTYCKMKLFITSKAHAVPTASYSQFLIVE